jgi:hypothetical protein
MYLINLVHSAFPHPPFVIDVTNLITFERAHGGAFVLGTALQNGSLRVRFPMALMEFFIDIILPAALRHPGFDAASNRNECQEYFLGVKAAGA